MRKILWKSFIQWLSELNLCSYKYRVDCFDSNSLRLSVLYRTANDRETANDPRPQLIPKVDRKWSREDLRNGMDWLQKRTDYKKEAFFSRLLKKKGKSTLHFRSIYTRRKKKWNKSEKDMVLTVCFFLRQLLQFSFKNVSSSPKNLRQAGRYTEKTLLF